MYSVRDDELGTGIGTGTPISFWAHLQTGIGQFFQRQTKGLRTINNNLKVFLKFHNK